MCGVPSRSTVAVICARSCLSGSGIALCLFRHFLFVFITRPHRFAEKKTNENHRKNTLRPKSLDRAVSNFFFELSLSEKLGL